MLLKCQHRPLLAIFMALIFRESLTLNFTAVSNVSHFTGEYSGSRLAYFRWRVWLLNHVAIQQRVPPVPKSANSSTNSVNRLEIRMKITPVSILDVDIAQQTVQIFARIEMWWVDPALAVSDELAGEFTNGNIDLLPHSVTIPSQSIWFPLLVLVEGTQDIGNILQHDMNIEVQQDGNMTFNYPFVLKFTCSFDVSRYPFDQHECTITFIDVSYIASIYTTLTPWDAELFQRFCVTGEWDLVSVKERLLNYPNSDMKYAQFILNIRRKTTFYVVIIVLPMVLTSYLNILVFLLPPDLGDKISYLVTLTVSLSVYTSFFNTDMPRGIETMPYIFMLLIFVLGEGFVIMLISLVLLRKYKAELYQQGTRNILTFGELRCKDFIGQASKTTSKLKVSARQLDRLSFVIALIVNTLGIIIILASMV